MVVHGCSRNSRVHNYSNVVVSQLGGTLLYKYGYPLPVSNLSKLLGQPVIDWLRGRDAIFDNAALIVAGESSA